MGVNKMGVNGVTMLRFLLVLVVLVESNGFMEKEEKFHDWQRYLTLL